MNKGEIDAIVDAWRALPPDEDAVLATVVHVRGSAYRRPGARMLILPDGRRVGTISGGCLESDVSRKAWWWTERDATLRVFDTTSDDNAVWEFGLGCNGVIEVLLERVRSSEAAGSLGFLAERRGGVLPVVIRAADDCPYRPGDRFPRSSLLRAHLRDAEREQRSRLVRLPDCEVFVEWVARPQRLVIFGAGHDAIPVVACAKQLGWEVTVADRRPAYACAARFPAADRVVLLRPSDPLAALEITSETAVVMMTHDYPLDVTLLPRVAERRPRYLGILGPRQRAERLFEAARCRPGDVHAPVGLDIGAETPEAIAISIVAEIQAELAGRSGTRLRQRIGTIHQAALESGLAIVPVPVPEPVTCEVALSA